MFQSMDGLFNSLPYSSASLAGAFFLVFAELVVLSARLRWLFPKTCRPCIFRTASMFFRGQLLNHFTMAGVGDAYKVQAIKPLCDKTHLSITKRVGIVLTDKVLEGSTLILIAIVGGGISAHALRSRLATVHTGFWILLFISVALVAYAFYRKGAPRFALHLKEQVASTLTFDILTVTILASLAAWALELSAILLLCSRYNITPAQGVLVLAALNLGTLIPAPPAKIGVFEGAMALGLTQVGIPFSAAIKIAATAHVLLLAGVGIGAALSILARRNPKLTTDSKKLAASEKLRKKSRPRFTDFLRGNS